MCDIIKKIKDFRHKLKISQIQLAEKAGLSQQHISKIESGQTLPNLQTLFRILDALGLDIAVAPRETKPIEENRAKAVLSQELPSAPPENRSDRPAPGHALPM
ncbi:MAG: helix-turn-helix transcriptional regulator [Elusimicrobia bacterium]|nr:helix-turn-helix transcriptional regulator [Elusimicrobiota bacterium]